MGDKEAGKGSKGHEVKPEVYVDTFKRRAKIFIAVNDLAKRMGFDNEADREKRILYRKLLRGSVIRELLRIELGFRKHPGVVDQALVLQNGRNEDLQYDSQAKRAVLYDISSSVADLFSLLSRNGVLVEKNMPPVEDKIMQAWERSSMLPVIEPPTAAAV